MSSCLMMNHESDEDVDLEALRVAALKSRKPRFPRVNHNNLIPIVPVSVETPDSIKTKIKQEKISPEREINAQDRDKVKDARSAKEDEKTSNFSGSTLENDPDILSMDDKEEEDSLEKLMDQLEAEISGKAPPPSNKSTKSKDKSKQNENDGADDEVELLQVKSGREPKAIIEIRESASPEQNSKQFGRNSSSPKRSLGRRSRSRLRSRSRSFYSGGRSYRRSKSPYWSRSPHKSRSPFRRSRSPYWSSRRTRSKSRSPFRRYRSPGRKRSPFSRFSRSRSRSYGRRRSPWSLSPRRRSKSPFYRDGVLSPRHRNFNSPGRPRRSYTPRDGSKSPRRRSRSPRRVPRHSPYRRSKSPYRPRSPYRRASLRRSQSPFLRRSKSPLDKLNSPGRSPVGKRHSNSPVRRSLERASSKGRSPPRRPKTGRSRSKSPVPFKNRSPLKVVEKNKLDDRMDKSRDRDRLGRRHRSLSRENNRTHERRLHKRGNFPSRKRSRSPKPKVTFEKSKPENQTDKESSSVPAAPLDPVLEARKKKFETLGEVDPTVDKKISLKAIKESTENPEEDEDALTINIENNLWDEPEESEDEFESRFKCDGARKNRAGNNRTVLSFRSLRESDASKKALNKPLTDENRRDRSHRQDAWSVRRSDRERKRRPLGRGKSEDNDTSKSKFKSDKSQDGDGKKSHRKPIVWNAKDERKPRPESKDNESSTVQTVSGDKNKSSENKSVNEGNKKSNKNSDLLETDDFDKLISDFEKELESDTCFSTNEVASTNQEENRKPRVSVRRDVFEPKTQTTQSSAKPPPPPPRIVKLSSTKPEQRLDPKSVAKVAEVKEKITLDEPRKVQDGPEDYIEDDDFVLETSATREKRGKEEEDKQSDLRAVLSKRRNERLTKVVSLHENMPTRLVQSAFQGLGHSKLKKPISEVQDLELPHLEKNVKSTGVEGRRVLLLHRDKNPLTSLKYTVPEVQPDTTIHQGFPWSKERRKRKLQRQQQDPSEDMDQEEEEERFEVEEEKHLRRFRLKRNITMSSQVNTQV